MNISNYKSKEFLLNLIDNKEEFLREALWSRGYVYVAIKNMFNNIEIDLLVGDNFNIYAIPFLENHLLNEGKSEKEVTRFVVEQFNNAKPRGSTNKSGRDFIEENKEELVLFIKNNYKHFSEKRDFEILKKNGLLEDVKDFLMQANLKSKTSFNISDFRNIEILKSKMLTEKDNVVFLEALKTYVEELKIKLESQDKNELSKTLDEINKIFIAIREDRSSSNINDIFFELTSLLENSINLSVTDIPLDTLMYCSMHEVFKGRAYSEELKQHLLNMFEYRDNFSNLNTKSDDYDERMIDEFQFLNWMEASWPEDKEIIKNVLKRNEREYLKEDSFRKLKFVIDKQITYEEIEKELTLYIPSFAHIPKDKRWSDFVVKKFVDSHGEYVDFLEVARFVNPRASYRTPVEKIKIPVTFLEKIWNGLDEKRNGAFLNLSRGSDHYISEENGDLFLQVTNFYLEKMLEKNIPQEHLLDTIDTIGKFLQNLSSQDSSYTKSNDFDYNEIFRMENSIAKLMDKIVMSMNDEQWKLISFNSYGTELKRYLLNSLVANARSANHLLVIQDVLFEKENDRSYNHGKTMDLLKSFNIDDIAGLKGKFFELMSKNDLNNIRENILNHIKSDDYGFNYRQSILSVDRYKQLYGETLLKNIRDRTLYDQLSDEEFANHLKTVLSIAQSLRFWSEDEVNKNFKDLKKKYKLKKAQLDESFFYNVESIKENFSYDFITNVVGNVNIAKLIKDMDSSFYPSVEQVGEVIGKVLESEKGNRFNKVEENVYEILNNLINGAPEKYLELKKELLSSKKYELFTVLNKYAVEEVNRVKQFIESEDENTWKESLSLLSKKDLLDKKNLEKIFMSKDYVKIKEFLNNYETKDLIKVINTLPYHVQKDVFFNNDIGLFKKEYYNYDDGKYTFNCEKLEDLKEAVHFLKTKKIIKFLHTDIVDNSYYIAKAKYECCDIIEHLKVGDSKENINYMIENFAYGFANNYYFKSTKYEASSLPRKLDEYELVKLLNTIDSQYGGLYYYTSDVNADFNFLKILAVSDVKEKSKKEELKGLENNFQQFIKVLDLLKDDPLNYFNVYLENIRDLDKYSHKFLINEKEDYEWREKRTLKFEDLPKDCIALNEFIQFFKQDPKWLEEINSFNNPRVSEGELEHKFLLNYVDMDVLFKGIKLYNEEINLNSNTANSRLLERVSIIAPYIFYFLIKKNKEESYPTEEFVSHHYSPEQYDEIVYKTLESSPNLILSSSSFYMRKVREGYNWSEQEKDLGWEFMNKKFTKMGISNLFKDYEFKGMMPDILLSANNENAMSVIDLLHEYIHSNNYSKDDMKTIAEMLDYYEKIHLSNDKYSNLVEYTVKRRPNGISEDSYALKERNLMHSGILSYFSNSADDEHKVIMKNLKTLLEGIVMREAIEANKEENITSKKIKKSLKF
jgi:hypothetical protein